MSLIFPFDYQEEPVGTFRQKLLIFTNYLIVTTSLLAGLVFSLHHTLPLTIQILSLTDGVTKPQLRIPKSQLSLQIVRGANLQVEMPETYFSFGSEESEMLATVTLDKSFERVLAHERDLAHERGLAHGRGLTHGRGLAHERSRGA